VPAQPAHRRDDHRRVRPEAAEPGYDVEELLATEVAAKPGLGDGDVCQLDAHASGNE